MKLSTKISLITILSVTLMIGIIASSVYYRTDSMLNKSIGEQQAVLASSKLEKISNLLSSKLKIIQAASNLPNFAKFINPDLRITGMTDSALDESLKEAVKISGPWQTFDVVDNSDRIVFSMEGTVVGTKITEDVSRNQALIEAKKGKVYYSDLVTDNRSGKPVIFFSAPIFENLESTNKVIGAIVASFDWNNALTILKEVSEPQSIFLYNKDGVFIGSNKDFLNKGILFEEDQKRKIVSDAINGVETTSYIEYSEKNNYSVLVSSAKEAGSSEYKGNKWFALLESPSDYIFSEVRFYLMETFFIILVISGVMVTFLLWLIISQIIKPIMNLTKTAKEIADGHLDKRMPLKGRDEIGQLSKSFNTMTDSLAMANRYVQSIIMAMPTGLVIVDKNGKIKMINDATCRIFDCKDKKMFYGKLVSKLFFYQSEEDSRVVKRVLEGERLSEYRMTVIKKNGAKVSISLSSSVLLDEDGMINAVVIVLKDMKELSDYAKMRLQEVTPILKQAAIGKLDKTIIIPEEEDEFTEHFVALNLMIEDLKELMRELKEKQLERERQNFELEATSKELFHAKEHLEEEVAKRTIELRDKVEELEKFNKLAVGREIKMIELKNKVAELQAEINEIKKEF